MSNTAPTVFISSTSRDLRDVRAAVRFHFRDTLGFDVYASEEASFPVRTPQDVYASCLANIAKADLVVLLINSRYGWIVDEEVEQPLSITRKEYRFAKEQGKPVWVFVRDETLSEETKINDLVTDAEGKGIELAGDEIDKARSLLHLHVQDRLVFDFLSEIRSNKEWIFSFRDAAEVLATIEQQVPHFLQSALLKHGVTYRSLDLDVTTPNAAALESLIDNSPSYAALNKAIMGVLPLVASDVSRSASIRARVRLGDLRAQAERQYAAVEGYNILRTGESRRRIFVLDSSMEVFGPHVWRVDTAHQQVLAASRRAARNYGLRGERFTRISVIFDPGHYLMDLDQEIWKASLRRHIDHHRSLGLRLGFALHSAIQSPPVGPFYNFYLISGLVLEIFDQINGYAFQLTLPQLLSAFEAFYVEVLHACDAEEGAFWVHEDMTVETVISKIGSLAAA